MTTLSVPALRCGGPAHLPHSLVLTAGPLTMLLEQGELRRICLGNREIIRRIYTSLRGSDWSAIPATLIEQKAELKTDSFQVDYTLVHKQAEYDFTWKITVTGTPQGAITFKAQGRAGSDFGTNRASLCLLHPLDECLGRPARFSASDGNVKEGHFPEMISPHQAFLDLQSFAHEIDPGFWLALKYSGETFEMEDQRNWTDGSFKTYSPPQDLPKPRKVEAGWETIQTVTMELQGTGNFSTSVSSAPAATGIGTLRPVPSSEKPLPVWGFGTASHGRPPSPRDIARIKVLAPAHLRTSFRLSHPSYQGEIARSVSEARLLGVPLEVALLIPDDRADDVLVDFATAWLASRGTVLRWLVFSETKDSVPPATLDAARRLLIHLAPEAEFSIGSKSDFVLLNRNRPESVLGFDLAYAMTPQVHLPDNRTMVESLQGQEWTLRLVASQWPNKKAHVTPITLKRSPLAMALKKPPGSLPPDHWKSQVDTRQYSLFGAGWTLASLKRLALFAPSAGLSATYFETTGLLGLLSGEELPEHALAVPGSDLRLNAQWVFPLYHVFADFAEFKGGEVTDLLSDLPLRFDGLILRRGKRCTLLLANLEETPGKVRLEGIGAVQGIRRLNEKTAMEAMSDPEGFRARPFESVAQTRVGSLDLELLPFELIRLELG